MISPVTATSAMPVRKEQTEQQTATQPKFRPELANFRPGTGEEAGFKPYKAPAEFMAMLAKSEAEAAWMDSAEGKAWQAEQLAKQNAQPVELAVYKGDKMVGFMAGGFAARDSIAGFLPSNWENMSIDDLSQVFRSRGFKVVTAKEGLNMNQGQADIIINRF
ncbi:hypothetical protein BYZ73_20660 [Rhodovulum viride]|uniref:Uncharacterized protein n=1 Tax=Rhodovulum viride TaxID=1231134 RepID=A0ABX9DCT7_9RHOB|nr:hypothetical protein [Rhodovulum viride]RAP39416.1 hypothetical protein BYZ73_20660 [Rhodovulum viride]